jgi:hypothetical protein
LLDVDTRQQAIDALLIQLGARADMARIDPSRTLVQVGGELWTVVGSTPNPSVDAPSLRRGGAKHKRVR